MIMNPYHTAYYIKEVVGGQETRFTVKTKNIALSCRCAFWGKLRVKRHIDTLSRSGTGNKKYRNNP
jgi:hypothetical protein